jgi:excisionase family DNA binding protein
VTEAAALTLAEAAEYLGIGRRTAYDLVARGEFPVPVVMVGRVRKVSRVLLERYLAGVGSSRES